MTLSFDLENHLQLRIASVYVATAPRSRPGLCKIGRSFRPDERASTGATWLPDLTVFSEVAFLDSVAAERAAHVHFSDVLVTDGDGVEWFRSTPELAHAQLQMQHAAQALAREQFDALVRKASELGLLSATTAAVVPNSALQAILLWRLPRQAVTALQVAQTALSSTPAAGPAIALLKKAGLTPVLSERVVLVNLPANGPLTRHLDRTIGAARWPAMLAYFAGFSKTGEPVKMSEWNLHQAPRRLSAAPSWA
jgi:hypothetical protein